MDFEYDPNKSQSNLAKHGIDFEAAKEIWQDSQRIIFPARSETEPRWVTVGLIHGKFWTVVYTTRNGRIRIISVRRSRVQEIKLYGT
ncbi:MAG: BrnT family toxin [Synechococcus sp.]|nr:BrnT family toxin [Synechococcus sp.]